MIDRAIWRLRAAIRPPVTLGVRAMVLDGARVLLVRHTYMPGLHMPGGGVDPGESARAAMARELREETGVAATEDGTLFHLYWNRRLAGRDHVALYVVRSFELGAGALTPRPEIAAAGFFDLSALPGDVTPATRRRLDEVVSGAPVADEW